MEISGELEAADLRQLLHDGVRRAGAANLEDCERRVAPLGLFRWGAILARTRTERRVWAVWPAASSLEDVATYLLGPVLGLLLRLRGVPCLHASAVAFGDSAVAFAGSEGAGKSTTAAALASRGHAVDFRRHRRARGTRRFVLRASGVSVSFAVAGVREHAVRSGQDSFRVFPPITTSGNLLLAENRLRFQEQPLPLGAVFLLGERSADPAAPFARDAAGARSCSSRWLQIPTPRICWTKICAPASSSCWAAW